MPNRYGLSLVSGPATEPLSLVQAKAHLRVEYSDDDNLIVALIATARETVEKALNRVLYTQTWRLTLDSFPYPTSFETFAPGQRNPYAYILDRYCIELALGGVVEITSITYPAISGTTTLDPSTYRVDSNAQPARIVPAEAFTWPTLQATVPGCVEVLFKAGSYGDGITQDSCPLSIKQAMLLLIGHLYANREATADKVLSTVPLAFDWLLSPFKVYASC